MATNVNGSNDKCEESCGQDDLQKVSDFFEANAGAIERWLKEKAPDEVINQINAVISKHSVCEKEHRSSVTSELYQQWLSSSTAPLKVKIKNVRTSEDSRSYPSHPSLPVEKEKAGGGNFLMSMKIELHPANKTIRCGINVAIHSSLLSSCDNEEARAYMRLHD